MDVINLSKQFAHIGARALVLPGTMPRIDVKRDRHGEYFEVLCGPGVPLHVSEVRKDLRHLLLVGRTRGGGRLRFLCGHDERHWFVAGVPDGRNLSSVEGAIEALKPLAVRNEQAWKEVRHRDRLKRRNAAYLRQGEWFFVPRPGLKVGPSLVLHGEPIQRGRSRPHIVEHLYREGGETVYVNHVHPNGITVKEYSDLVSRNPKERNNGWRVMRRNATVFAKGRVRHPDHATVSLWCWHQVLMNTENQAAGSPFVAFLD